MVCDVVDKLLYEWNKTISSGQFHRVAINDQYCVNPENIYEPIPRRDIRNAKRAGGGGLSKAILFCINTYEPKLEIIEGLGGGCVKPGMGSWSNQKPSVGVLLFSGITYLIPSITLTGRVVIY